MRDGVLVHVLEALADLLDHDRCIHLAIRSLRLLLDAVEQLATGTALHIITHNKTNQCY